MVLLTCITCTNPVRTLIKYEWKNGVKLFCMIFVSYVFLSEIQITLFPDTELQFKVQSVCDV